MSVGKINLIQEILQNNVYLPHSGLYRQLENSLQKLSKSDLSNLNLIIKIKNENH